MATRTRTTASANDMSCWDKVEACLNAGSTHVLLYGPPGTGKTYAGLNMGLLPDQQAHRLQCTEEMSDGKIVGHPMPISASKWEYILGPAILAWQGNGTRGDRLVVDEGDKLYGDAASIMHGMLDSLESCKWQHPITKEIHRPKPGFSVVLTTNLENMRDLPEALADRFPIKIRIDRPHPAALERLPEDLRSAAAASVDAPAHRRFSLRTFLEYSKLRPQLGQDLAAQICFGEHAQSILDTLKVEAL